MRTARMMFTVAVLGVCLAAQARATTMIYVPIEGLYDMSDLVVRGTVQSHTSFWGEHGEMFTDWTLHVDEVLYGERIEQVTVRQMGGEIDGRRAMIPGDAQFSDGEQVVVFLVEEDGVHYLTALGQAVLEVSAQGDLPVPGGTVTLPYSSADPVRPFQATLLRDLSDIAFYAPEDGQFFHLESELLTLDQLRAMSPTHREPAPAAGGVQ